jgi:hypothetical protein
MDGLDKNYSITEDISEEHALENSRSNIIHAATDTTAEVPGIVTHSQRAVNKADRTNFAAIIKHKCCNLRCLSALSVKILHACRVRYLAMSQAESRTWLSHMMENQPMTGRQYHIQHKVLSSKLFYFLLPAKIFYSSVCAGARL